MQPITKQNSSATSLYSNFFFRIRTMASSRTENPNGLAEISCDDDVNAATRVPAEIECRMFWKAGNFAGTSTSKMSAASTGLLEHARVHPKFLHSNATSHKWAFGAIAELMDNSVDEIEHGATFVKVDKIDIMKDKSPALLFLDDGGGMNPERLRKCMSLGYSSKKTNTTIGQYGNGFKTSTMRLGADVIVFSRVTHASQATQSIGLLSYTFLRTTGQDDVIVPMIDFDISGHWAEPLIYGSKDDWTFNLKTILEWSPFASKNELMQQFEDIGPHGTKVIIYNLWLNDEGIYELSFDDDSEDIRLRDETNIETTKFSKKQIAGLSHIQHRHRFSLRDYASMLYLRKFKNFQIILRGKPVQQFDIRDELKHRKVIAYKPQLATGLKTISVETTIGFAKEAPNGSIGGFNVYHKNRLIKPYWKVTSDGSAVGNGVIGVLEVNFMEPTHDKQDFERSSLFVRMESRLKQMISEYWKGHRHLIIYQVSGSSPLVRQQESPVQPSTRHAAKKHQQFPVNLQANTRQLLTNEQPTIPPTIELSDDEEETTEDYPLARSIDEICEENIKLFTRCEEEMQKETELKLVIEELQKELEQMKRKCAELSVHLEARKKQALC